MFVFVSSLVCLFVCLFVCVLVYSRGGGGEKGCLAEQTIFYRKHDRRALDPSGEGARLDGGSHMDLLL